MSRGFKKYKWVGLIAFSLLYNMVYLARFNVNYRIEDIAAELSLSETLQGVLAMSVFVGYTIGSFFNGYAADRFGAKKSVLTGIVVSAALNMLITLQSDWILIMILWFVNGFFQSMIWVGGVSMLSHWWQEGERGKGIGIANFFSGMSHATAYLIPLLLAGVMPALGWRVDFILPMFIMLFFGLLFGVFAVERPERKGILPYAEPRGQRSEKERQLKKLRESHANPWRYFLRQKSVLWWCGIAMTSSLCRYGLLEWIPIYYSTSGNQPNILTESFSNLTLPIGMAFGTLSMTWLAGAKLVENKGIIITALAAICGTLVVLFPILADTGAVLTGIFFTGFTLYGINGILWLYAIDEGGRFYAGTLAGILNAFAYLGACLEQWLLPGIMNWIKSELFVFMSIEIFCICIVVMGMVVSKKNTVVVPEVQE